MSTPEDQSQPEPEQLQYTEQNHSLELEEFRLNRYLAACGIDSRRKCDDLIQNGLVYVNGYVCKDLSQKVTTDDFVKIDGKRVLPKELKTVIFNKPRGCVCTKNDELERETIYEFLPPTLRHLNHVGRLDQDSEGLLILTNDGDLAQQLSHPSQKVEKEYLVTTNQAYDNDVLDTFLRGVFIGKGMPRAKAKAVRRLLEPGRWAELSPEDIEMLQTNPKEQLKGYRSSPIKTKKQASRGGANKSRRKPSASRSTPRNKSYKRRK